LGQSVSSLFSYRLSFINPSLSLWFIKFSALPLPHTTPPNHPHLNKKTMSVSATPLPDNAWSTASKSEVKSPLVRSSALNTNGRSTSHPVHYDTNNTLHCSIQRCTNMAQFKCWKCEKLLCLAHCKKVSDQYQTYDYCPDCADTYRFFIRIFLISLTIIGIAGIGFMIYYFSQWQIIGHSKFFQAKKTIYCLTFFLFCTIGTGSAS